VEAGQAGGWSRIEAAQETLGLEHTIRHIAFVFLILAGPALAGLGIASRGDAGTSTSPAAPEPIAKDPYVGAIAVDAESGLVLFDDNAEAVIYPASMVKLMDLLVILEKVERGDLQLSDTVTVDAEAARMGGSQVYLGEGEKFTVDDLLYAMMVESANDAAMALAVHVAGSRESFVQLMNERARELGMKATQFVSPHGLPPGKGQTPDVSTPYDMSLLAREVVRHPESLRYTGCREKVFRPDQQPLVMHNHNHILGTVEGCDGLKTGYFRAAGFSTTATALRDGRRLVVVVAGSSDPKTRDRTAQRLLTELFLPARSRPEASRQETEHLAAQPAVSQ
jgi:D-alanyl-D-alanine carboxypeptidase (penicillin-binding protein 5/6)